MWYKFKIKFDMSNIQWYIMLPYNNCPNKTMPLRVLRLGLGRDVTCHLEFESRLYIQNNSRKKWPIHIAPIFRSNFDLKLTNFSKVFTFCQYFLMKLTSFVESWAYLVQFVENFEKWSHSCTKMCKEKGVIDILLRLILLPTGMFTACPYNNDNILHFCSAFS